MNFWQRLKYAFTGQTKSHVDLSPTWEIGQPSYPEFNFENNVRHGIRKNEIIFACISKTANTAAQIRAKLVNGAGEEIEDTKHPLLDLIKRPNPFMNQFDFIGSITIYQKLAGRAVYEKERGPNGEVIALWDLRPDWVFPIVGYNIIQAYEYRVPGQKSIYLKPENVLDFKLFDPLNKIHPFPPVSVAARIGDVDNAETDYLKLYMEHGGTPPGLLTSKIKLTDNAIENAHKRWRARYGGIKGWIDPAILDSDITYQKIGDSFKEMGFEVLDRRSEVRICEVLDVPPLIINAWAGLERSTFENAEQIQKTWWHNSLIPLYANMLDVLNYGLANEYDDDVFIEWDYSEVPALKEQSADLWERVGSGVNGGWVTPNEARESVGLPPIEGGDELRAPMQFGQDPNQEDDNKKPDKPNNDNGNGKKHLHKDYASSEGARGELEKILKASQLEWFGEQRARIETEMLPEVARASP